MILIITVLIMIMIDRLQTLVTKKTIARIVRNSLINAAGETACNAHLRMIFYLYGKSVRSKRAKHTVNTSIILIVICCIKFSIRR